MPLASVIHYLERSEGLGCPKSPESVLSLRRCPSMGFELIRSCLMLSIGFCLFLCLGSTEEGIWP